MSKLEEHLANVVTMIEEIGKDAEQVAERFAGDVEGHLRVVESHLMEIINSAKPTPTETPAPAPVAEPVAVEPEPAEAAPVVEPAAAPAAKTTRK